MGPKASVPLEHIVRCLGVLYHDGHKERVLVAPHTYISGYAKGEGVCGRCNELYKKLVPENNKI